MLSTFLEAGVLSSNLRPPALGATHLSPPTDARAHEATHADEWPVMLFGDQWIIYTHMPLIIQGPSLNKLLHHSPNQQSSLSQSAACSPVHPISSSPLEYDGDFFFPLCEVLNLRRNSIFLFFSLLNPDMSQQISLAEYLNHFCFWFEKFSLWYLIHLLVFFVCFLGEKWSCNKNSIVPALHWS